MPIVLLELARVERVIAAKTSLYDTQAVPLERLTTEVNTLMGRLHAARQRIEAYEAGLFEQKQRRFEAKILAAAENDME